MNTTDTKLAEYKALADRLAEALEELRFQSGIPHGSVELEEWRELSRRDD